MLSLLQANKSLISKTNASCSLNLEDSVSRDNEVPDRVISPELYRRNAEFL